jgi:hypothetical protein
MSHSNEQKIILRQNTDVPPLFGGKHSRTPFWKKKNTIWEARIRKKRFRRNSPDQKAKIIIYLMTLMHYTQIDHLPIIYIVPVAKATQIESLAELDNLAKSARIGAEEWLKRRKRFIRPILSFQVKRAAGGRSFITMFSKVRIDREGRITMISSVRKGSPQYGVYRDWMMRKFIEDGREFRIERLQGMELTFKFKDQIFGEVLKPHVTRMRPYYYIPIEEFGKIQLKH